MNRLTLLDDLPRRRQLATPHWLASQGGAVRVIEAGWGACALFEQAHIPGAAYLDTSQLETLPYFNKVSDAALLALLLAYGVRHDTTVLLYGRATLAAARAAHLLLYAGVRDVRLLDGGFDGWCRAGLPLQSGVAAPLAPAFSFGAPFPGRPDYLMGLDGARAVLAAPGAALVSIRSWSEYSGQTSGYSYIAARGDIPGALWGHAGVDGDVNSMSHFQLDDGGMRPAAHIARQWRAQGIGPELACTFYCGTGWRASLAFFYAYLMGWERISVFDGGWFEWSSAVLQSQHESISPAAPCRLPAAT